MRMLVFGLAFLFAAVQPGVGNCDVLLNEVMADPASDWDGDATYNFRSDEWIEVVNTGPSDVDLSAFLLGDDVGDPVFGFVGMLASGATRVVYGSESVVWESANGESSTGLRLSNDGDTVTLWEISGGDTLLVDAYTFNTHEADDDRSTGRLPDGAADWQIFDGLNPYGGEGPPVGNGLLPTPGDPNGETTTPIVQTTWGRIKSFIGTD